MGGGAGVGDGEWWVDGIRSVQTIKLYFKSQWLLKVINISHIQNTNCHTYNWCYCGYSKDKWNYSLVAVYIIVKVD